MATGLLGYCCAFWFPVFIMQELFFPFPSKFSLSILLLLQLALLMFSAHLCCLQSWLHSVGLALGCASCFIFTIIPWGWLSNFLLVMQETNWTLNHLVIASQITSNLTWIPTSLPTITLCVKGLLHTVCVTAIDLFPASIEPWTLSALNSFFLLLRRDCSTLSSAHQDWLSPVVLLRLPWVWVRFV